MAKNMLRIVWVIAVAAPFFFQDIGFSQEGPQQGESISIVTYYPSPYGSYNQLHVGGGGLRLAKVVEKVPADKWTDIDVSPFPAGGLYIISAVPTNKEPFLTYMILFSAGPKGTDLVMFPGGGAIAEDVPQDKEELALWWRNKMMFAQFRTQKSTDATSFQLQIKTAKDCDVYVGKTLSYWPNQEH